MKMKSYTWSGTTADGKKSTGEINAMSENLAKFRLSQQGITQCTLCKKRKSLFRKINKKITSIDITLFFRQLATLISASIPIVQACHILANNQEKILLKSLINTLKEELTAGKGFVSGLRKHPRHFDELTCQLIQTGEYTGTLEIMLNRIAQHKEKILTLKNKIIQALFYPTIIVLVAIIVTMTMLIFVVPRFEEIFQTMQGKLPAFTQLVVAISTFFRHDAWLLAIPMTGISLLIYYFKKIDALDRLILKFPLVGNFLQKIYIARFARNLAITFAAGVPITDALKIIAHACGNHEYAIAILKLQTQIATGQQLHMAMQASSLFPLIAVQMVQVGEESGMLENMLNKIAELYESDIDHLIINLSYLLEPLIMIILGVLIGGLVIAMYLPIFKLGTVI